MIGAVSSNIYPSHSRNKMLWLDGARTLAQNAFRHSHNFKRMQNLRNLSRENRHWLSYHIY